MGFIKQVRTYFFRKTAPINLEGKKINFQNSQRPDQNAFEELMASSLFFKEAEDRAKTNVGDSIENEVGTVAITSDVKAKANTDGFEVDRTLVTHAGQLPTVEATETQEITGTTPFDDVILEVTVDPAITTRNNFLLRWSDTFLAWVQSLNDRVEVLEATTPTTIEWKSQVITDADVIVTETSGSPLVPISPTFIRVDLNSDTVNIIKYYIKDELMYIDFKLIGEITRPVAPPDGFDREYTVWLKAPDSVAFTQTARAVGYGINTPLTNKAIRLSTVNFGTTTIVPEFGATLADGDATSNLVTLEGVIQIRTV